MDADRNRPLRVAIRYIFFAIVLTASLNFVSVSSTLWSNIRSSMKGQGLFSPSVSLWLGGGPEPRISYDNKTVVLSQDLAGDAFSGVLDEDGDGLTQRDEVAQMTSDLNPDTDGDGVKDSEDGCPNCSVRTYEGRVLSAMVAANLRRVEPSPSTGRIYIKSGYYDSVVVEYSKAKIINVPDQSFLVLRELSDPSPSVMSFFKVVFVPGVLYLYRSEFVCGTGCSDIRFFVLTHVPFLGPRTVVSFQVRS